MVILHSSLFPPTSPRLRHRRATDARAAVLASGTALVPGARLPAPRRSSVRGPQEGARPTPLVLPVGAAREPSPRPPRPLPRGPLPPSEAGGKRPAAPRPRPSGGCWRPLGGRAVRRKAPPGRCRLGAAGGRRQHGAAVPQRWRNLLSARPAPWDLLTHSFGSLARRVRKSFLTKYFGKC